MRRLIAALLGLMIWCQVVPGPRVGAQPSPTAIVSRIRTTNDRPIDFHAAVFPDTVYVGQQVTYQVAVLLSDQARSRLRRNPEFLPPELRGLLAFELGTPTRVPSRSYGGRQAYEAHVFQRAMFAVSDGMVRVPAPQLTYSLPQSASYFSREERYVVRAESAQLVVKPLPLEGRPDDFAGAVGVLRASARFDSSAVRVGDPLILTVRIEGAGNVRLLPRPTLELSWATVVPGSERVQVDTSGALVRGAKEFDFLLTPTRDGRTTLPVVRYPYFDPYRKGYFVAETAPADIRVASGGLASIAPAEDGDRLPLRAWRHREVRTLSDVPAAVSLLIALLLLLAPVPAVLVGLRRTRRGRAATQGIEAVTHLRPVAADDDSVAGVARRTRRTLLAQLAARLQVPPAEVVTRNDLERVLRRRGVTRQTTRDALALLDELAVRGFGGDAAATVAAAGRPDRAVSTLEQQATELLQRVDGEAVTHGRTRLWGRRRLRRVTWTLVLLSAATGAMSLMVPGGTVPAQTGRVRPPVGNSERASASASVSGPASSTAAIVTCESRRSDGAASGVPVSGVTRGASRGVTPLDLLVDEATAAYQARRFATAAQRFASAVMACPRDADLLVNWGTASWAAGDTVMAVVAWQRAARLDPLAADVQQRLALLPAGARGGQADVPMVPVQALAVSAVLAWVAAWLVWFIAWRGPQARPGLTTVGSGLLLLAMAAAITAWWGRQALDATGLAVVRRPETLRAAPGFEAATLGGVSTGDIVRLGSAQEGWLRVTLTDDRIGWIPASRLAPLLVTTVTR